MKPDSCAGLNTRHHAPEHIVKKRRLGSSKTISSLVLVLVTGLVGLSMQHRRQQEQTQQAHTEIDNALEASTKAHGNGNPMDGLPDSSGDAAEVQGDQDAAPETTTKTTRSTDQNINNTAEGKLPAEVHYCHDGDTCRLRIAEALWLNVRLAAIDAPEVPKGKKDRRGQVMGEQARDYLNTLVKGQPIQIQQLDLDPYNRPVVAIWLKDAGKRQNINLQLVREGYAEVYRGKTKRFDKTAYFAAEEEAKRLKKGIWGVANYSSPAEYRKKLKATAVNDTRD